MPTFRNRDRQTVIDITLTNSKDNFVRDWRVSADCSFSDHSRITFTLDFQSPLGVPFRNPRLTDWGTFHDKVRMGMERPQSCGPLPSNLEYTVNNFTRLLKESYESSCPLKFPGRRKQPRWWTKELQVQRSTVRKSFNRAKLTGLQGDWNNYKVCFNKYKGDLKRAKRISWRNYCESVDGVNEMSRFRRIISKDPRDIGYIQREDNSWTESSSETLSLLVEAHFPGCESTGTEAEDQRSNMLEGIGHDSGQVDEIVTRDKLAWAVKTFDPYKSPGPDGVFPAMLCNIPDTALFLLEDIFKSCLNNRYLPHGWREVRVVFIPKAGRACHSKPKDFRPISLSSFLLKTLERLIDLHLRSKIETHLISNAQHAYLRGKSVESALHEVVGCIEHSLEHREYTLAAFLDIEGAFNNIKTEAIRDSLVEHGVDDFLVSWIIVMLESRIINSTLGDEVIRRRVTRGTPQGGVLSPFLWLLAVNSILKTFESKGRKIVAYADDVVILIRGKFLSTISDIMQDSLGDLSSWAKTSGLGVNPSKTELVLFTRKYKVDNFKLPKLDGVELSLSGGAKYLGTFLDKKLSWKLNTQERLRKGLNAYYACRNSIGRNWGLRPGMVNWIYTSVVRPIITYGCTVWWEAMRKRSYRTILNKAQRCACLGITGALGSTPQAALEIILNLLPIEHYVESVAARNLLRLSESSLAKPLRVGHTRILYKAGLRGQDIDPSGISDYKVATYYFGVSPSVEFPSRVDWVGSDKLFDGCAVFTDGSKMDSGTGAGVYLVDNDIKRSYRLPNECSVFQAEIYAIWKATELIGAHVERGSTVTIYVDSQAALKALECNQTHSNLVHDCRRALEELLVLYQVRLCWVPGHCDVQGNEVADELARHGSGLDHDTRERGVKPPICHFYRLIFERFRDCADQSWGSRSDCIVSRALWPKLNANATETLMELDRYSLRILVGVITGHCSIGAFRGKWDNNTQDFCRVCGDAEEPETIEHIMCNCPRLQGHRLKWLGNRFLDELSNVAGCKLSNILGFIRGIGWLFKGPSTVTLTPNP